jgi:hypothetical protein
MLQRSGIPSEDRYKAGQVLNFTFLQSKLILHRERLGLYFYLRDLVFEVSIFRRE